MDSGKLRHRVVLDRRVYVQGAGGSTEHVYVEEATCRAEIVAVSGREYFAAAQVQSEVSTKIRIRWRAGVDSTWRVRVVQPNDSPAEEDWYDVVSVLPDARSGRRWLWLMCVHRFAEGVRRGD
jgi:SPP1 family predicted phage head-tail adaptor